MTPSGLKNQKQNDMPTPEATINLITSWFDEINISTEVYPLI